MSPSPSTQPQPPRLWTAVVPAMAIPFLAALCYFVLFSEHMVARYLYGAAKIFLVVWPLIGLRFILRQPFPWIRWGDPKHARAIPLGIFSGLAVGGLAFLLMRTPLGTMVQACAGDIRTKTIQLGILDYYWPFAIFVSLFHSFLEEYYWRWFVFGSLRQVLPPWAAHGLAAAAFAAHHIVITTQYFPLGWGLFLGSLVGVGGFIFSWLYARQQTLAGAWVSHLIIDLALMTIGYQLVT